MLNATFFVVVALLIFVRAYTHLTKPSPVSVSAMLIVGILAFLINGAIALQLAPAQQSVWPSDGGNIGQGFPSQPMSDFA